MRFQFFRRFHSLFGPIWLTLELVATLLVSAPGRAEEARVGFSNSVTLFPPKAMLTRRALTTTNLKAKLQIEFALKMRNFEELQARVGRGEIISRAEMTERYFPQKAGYVALARWVRKQGLTIMHTDKTQLAVFARGTVAQIQKALAVEMVGVTVEGTDYQAANSSPSLPESVAAPVLGINGLQPYHHPRKHVIFAPQTANAPPFLINEILTAYNATGLGVTGANQKIAILIDTVPSTSDVSTFWTNNSVSQSLSNYETVNVNNTTLPAVSGEETLDVEWSSGIAPGAKVRVYATGALDDTSLNNGFSRIINDLPSQTQIHQLSISLGLGETYSTSSQLQTDAQYLATIAAGGVSVFVSSGDDGSTPDDNDGTTGPLQVENYASDPSVTAVGGTSLVLNTGTGQVSAETAWSGSGGGTSIQFARPSWQTGTGVPSGSFRLVPDVALAADPNTGAYVYLSGKKQQIGGTSWSAPTWAGFCALINQARANAGLGSLGLLNPKIYPLLGTACFRDVTSGSNATSSSSGKYAATVGYDEVTGLGVPNVTALMAALVGAPVIFSFTPTSGIIGASVTITGANFSSTTAVKFNGTSASFTVNSATQITATVPTGATSGLISVTNAQSTASSSASFSVLTGNGLPTITSFTPTTGSSGVAVTITGTNFGSVSSVAFNGATAAFTVNSQTQITATVPTLATTGTISVTTATGTATSSGNFTYTGPPPTSVLISQVYGGGGNSGATYRNDFIELFNRGTAAVSLAGWSVQYASATGSSWTSTSLSGSIAPGRYYLIQESSSGSAGATLPTANVSSGTPMSSTNGKVALVNSTTALTVSNPVGGTTVVDFVGYGTANAFEGTAAAPQLSASTAAIRAGGGSIDSNNNSADFAAGTPTPRNAATVPDLTIAASHSGNFVLGDQGDVYTVTVSNAGVGASGGTVNVVDTLPAGLTATAISGTGWTTTLATLTATRSDSLPPGTSYPPVSISFNVEHNAASSVTNSATVSGGAETNTTNDTATDPTTILTPLQSWRNTYFGTTANSGASADSAIAANDGMSNLLKYALGLNPLVPAVNPAVLDGSTGFLRLTVSKNPNAFDVTFLGEVSGDLTSTSNWTTTGTTVDHNTSTLFQFHDNTPLSPTSDQRYLRLHITDP